MMNELVGTEGLYLLAGGILYNFEKSHFDKAVMGRGGGDVCCFTLANLIKTAAVCMYIIPSYCLPAALNIDTTA